MVSVCWLVGCASPAPALILIGSANCFCYALVFLLASQIFSPLSLTRYREQTHSIKHAVGFFPSVLAALTLVSEQVKQGGQARHSYQMRWTAV